MEASQEYEPAIPYSDKRASWYFHLDIDGYKGCITDSPRVTALSITLQDNTIIKLRYGGYQRCNYHINNRKFYVVFPPKGAQEQLDKIQEHNIKSMQIQNIRKETKKYEDIVLDLKNNGFFRKDVNAILAKAKEKDKQILDIQDHPYRLMYRVEINK